MKIISDSLMFCSLKYQAAILGYVLMPNHIHLVLHFNEGKKRIDFMRDFKKYTSTKIRQEIERYQPDLLEKLLYQKGEQVFKVWQDRFDELYIESKELLEQKLNYIHCNPMQSHWNLVSRPEDYPYSSASYYELDKQPDVQVTHYLEFI